MKFLCKFFHLNKAHRSLAEKTHTLNIYSL